MASTETLASAATGFLPASAKAYTDPARLRNWNGTTSPSSCPCPGTAARLLRNRLPDWTKAQHRAQASYHRTRIEKLGVVWERVWQRAFAEAFGRAPTFGDYQITAIGRAEVAERHKRVLRHCAYSATVHGRLAGAHERAASARNLTRRKTP
jgi:hypothetical protein